jgi:hypothetical protein
VAGGAFSAPSRLASWDGAVWSAFGGGADGSVRTLVSTGSTLLVGGAFTAVGGVPAARVAQWDGQNWSSLGQGTDDTVFALRPSPDGIYVGGRFSAAGGVPSPWIARWRDAATWVAEDSSLHAPKLARLLPNRPNPFQSMSELAFELDQSVQSSLAIYDVAGRRVRRVYEGTASAGLHSVIFDGRDDQGRHLPAGVYFVRLDTGRATDVRKIVSIGGAP